MSGTIDVNKDGETNTMRVTLRGLLVLAVACCLQTQAQNFATDYQQALEHRRQGETEQARQDLLALLEQSHRHHTERKRDAIHGSLAALAFSEGKSEEADAWLAKIKDEHTRKHLQIVLWYRQRQGDKILELLKDEDLTTWPDRTIYTAAVNRGDQLMTQDPEAALKDLLLARRYTIDARQEGRVYIKLAELHHEQFNNIPKAKAYYEQALARNRLTDKMHAIISERLAKLDTP